MRILESVWFLVDVSEGFVVILVRFVLLLGEFFHSSIPLSLYFVESSIDFSFGFSLFAGVDSHDGYVLLVNGAGFGGGLSSSVF